MSHKWRTQLHQTINKLRQETSNGKSSKICWQFPPGQNLTLSPARKLVFLQRKRKPNTQHKRKQQKKNEKEQQKQSLYNNGFNFQQATHKEIVIKIIQKATCNKNK